MSKKHVTHQIFVIYKLFVNLHNIKVSNHQNVVQLTKKAAIRSGAVYWSSIYTDDIETSSHRLSLAICLEILFIILFIPTIGLGLATVQIKFNTY